MSETITHVEALKRLKASMETMPWERRSAREDSWIRFIDEALAAPDRQSAADALAAALKGVRINIAYAYQPENCGDHCRNNCRDCVLKNTLDDLDAALAAWDSERRQVERMARQRAWAQIDCPSCPAKAGERCDLSAPRPKFTECCKARLLARPILTPYRSRN